MSEMKLVFKKEPRGRLFSVESPGSDAASSSSHLASHRTNKKARLETASENSPPVSMATINVRKIEILCVASSFGVLTRTDFYSHAQQLDPFCPATPLRQNYSGLNAPLLNIDSNSLLPSPWKTNAWNHVLSPSSMSSPSLLAPRGPNAGAFTENSDPSFLDHPRKNGKDMATLLSLQDRSTYFTRSRKAKKDENVRLPFQRSFHAHSSKEKAVTPSIADTGISQELLPVGVRLWRMVNEMSMAKPHMMQWTDDGNAFYVNHSDEDGVEFKTVMEAYSFKTVKFQSFHRLLNRLKFKVATIE
jgi:hypothetical protein